MKKKSNIICNGCCKPIDLLDEHHVCIKPKIQWKWNSPRKSFESRIKQELMDNIATDRMVNSQEENKKAHTLCSS
jgi:hypothetical protein